MPALDRAVALAQEEHVAAGVGDDLRLHVAGAVDVPLQEDLGSPEVRLGLARRAPERFVEMLGVAYDVHALAASAERRLHEEGEPDALRLLLRVPDVDGLRRSRHDRHAAAVGDQARGRLVAHVLDRLGGRTDEREPAVVHGLRELRALREEAVAGMDQRRPSLVRGLEDGLDREVGLGGEGGPDPERLVGHLHVQGVAVRVGVDRDGGEPEVPAGPDDADRDLAPVGDQDLLFRRHGSTYDGRDARRRIKPCCRRMSSSARSLPPDSSPRCVSRRLPVPRTERRGTSPSRAPPSGPWSAQAIRRPDAGGSAGPGRTCRVEPSCSRSSFAPRGCLRTRRA